MGRAPMRGLPCGALLCLLALNGALVAGKPADAIDVHADIYQGLPTPTGAFNFMVQIKIPVDDGHGSYTWEHSCGGTLISPDTVLTAAHCVVQSDESLIPFQALLMVVEGVEYAAADILVNPGYNSSALQDWNQDLQDNWVTDPPPNYDVAAIKLATAVPNATLAALPSADLELTAGQTVEVAGWGRTGGSENLPASTTLLYATLQLVAPFNWDNQQVPGSCPAPSFPDVLCAINDVTGANACAGDSGGPLILRDYTTGAATVVGVVSNGPSCSDVNYGFYTDVRHYVNEIQVWTTV